MTSLQNMIDSTLKNKIELMLTNDLTVGRIDNNLIPFTNNQIDNFIKDNKDNILRVIVTMINDYNHDNELETLLDPPLDWIGEYLYYFVNINI